MASRLTIICSLCIPCADPENFLGGGGCPNSQKGPRFLGWDFDSDCASSWSLFTYYFSILFKNETLTLSK